MVIGMPLNKSAHISLASLTKPVYSGLMSCDAPFITQPVAGTPQIARLLEGAMGSAQMLVKSKSRKVLFSA
jgi:hypothetical protein